MQLESLGTLSVNAFLNEYWQKKPILIRNAIKTSSLPIEADELAGLACEAQVESRIISNIDDSWKLKHGPFEETLFSTLPASNWTLLVQAVDHWSPKAADFLQQFNFIPSWRIDDLMVSYATKGGGVGPHFDQYDVFLVQSHGQRKWDVGTIYDDDAKLVQDIPVSILNDFEAEESWIANPGDIVYIPPGYGHNGIALSDECITCSVGFRAPSHSEVLCEFADFIGVKLSEALRYEDPDLTTQTHSGEIKTAAIDNFQTILSKYTNDKSLISEWLGQYASTPKYPEQHEIDKEHYTLDKLTKNLSLNKELIKNESSRFYFIENLPVHKLFVDGARIDTHNISNEFIEFLCDNREIELINFTLKREYLHLLLKLINMGSLYFPE